jgi:two-component system, sensor histidine kinase and response regulator
MSDSRVLIVDDDAALLLALPAAIRLRMAELKVDTCDSAAAALEQIAGTDYDAVVSDIKMPGMDGLALLAEIRALRPDTPTLLITGHGEHDLALQALRGGAFDFIQKPIDREYFIASLNRALQLRRLARQVEEQKRALESHAYELEAVVQERTRELLEANQAKDRFLAILSHELRTPLTPIQASVELLRRTVHDPDRVLRAADVIERNVRLQTRLVNDLLDLSRITRGKLSLDLRPVPLTELVGQTLDGLQSDAEAARLVLIWIPPDSELYANVDPFRVQQILLNLVSNAIKYTEPGGEIRVELCRAGDNIRLVVADNGIGIVPEALPLIFDMFHQEEEGPARRGLGIGLALVESLARIQGGRVWAESDGPGHGSRFTLEFPAIPAPRYWAPVSPTDASWDCALPEVLVVEDSADSRETLSEVLRTFGYQVRSAASAEEALQLLAEWQPAVILSDIGLPGVSGYELMRRVRQMPRLADVVALAATGYGSQENQQEALAAGFNAHVTKPIDLTALDRQLRELLLRVPQSA